MSFNPQEVEILAQVVDATRQGGSAYANVVVATNLVTQGLLLAHPNLMNPANPSEVAYTATDAGVSVVDQMRGAPAAVPASAPIADQVAAAPIASQQGRLEIVNGFVAPEKGRRRQINAHPKRATYDFASLELGQAIFVPATEKMPNPKKSLSSSITAQNRKYREFEPPRMFKTFGAEAGQQFGEVIAPSDGAYIVRVPYEEPKPKKVKEAPVAEAQPTA